VYPKGADSMAISGFCFENALVSSEWATAVLVCTNRLRKQFSPCTVPISDGEAFIPVWVSGCRLSAMSIASSLMDGCDVVGVLGVLQLESFELRHQLQGLGYLIIPFYHKTTYCQELHS